ncbi:uncharacterized protein LOC110268421 [Arachis ipaensis]|uniref:uncharacterized protein LOC110268421 n=1 Tax=Arachis ipaensis TaxID=130454 RepID=UPI000A2B8C7F|nr:uncharacterized protein LOC110268421 [Arachis ipaensis]
MELEEKREESCNVNEKEKGKRGLTTPLAQERTEGRERVTRLRKRESEGAAAPSRGRGGAAAAAASPEEETPPLSQDVAAEASPPSRRAVTPRENARGKREQTPSRIPSPSNLPRHRRVSISTVYLFHRRAELWEEGSERDGKGRHLPPLSRRQIHVTATNRHCSGCRKPPPSLCLLGLNSDDFISKLRLQLDHRSFWPLSEMPPGQLGIAAVPFCSYCRIELLGLPVAIKAVSAIAEVSRPAIEAAVDFGRRGMVLVTPLVYGFNFRG